MRKIITPLWPVIIVTPSVLMIDWIIQLNATVFPERIYNPAYPPLSLAIPLFLFGLFMVWYCDCRLATLGFAFTIGGFLGNVLMRYIYGPVADYIPLPSWWYQGAGWEFNFADFCLLLGFLIISFTVILILTGRLYDTSERAR